MVGVTLSVLGMFEDLYYASVAKAKHLLHVVNVLLDNGFKKEDDVYFSYSSGPLDSLGPITYGAFKNFLTSNCNLLLDEVLINILKHGLIEKTKEDIKRGTSLKNDPFPGLRRIEDIQLLDNVHNMNSAIIFAHLSEKYRNFVMDEASSSVSQAQRALADLTITSPKASPALVYISPYNLNERAKIFDMEGVADLPCICDPDCICYPVCMSDRTQNCLCEENALFTRVTEGADIDELDVPDMIRSPAVSSRDSDSECDTIVDSTSEDECDVSITDGLATDMDNMTIASADSTEPESKAYRKLPDPASHMNSDFRNVSVSYSIYGAEILREQFAMAQRYDTYPDAETLAYIKAMREPWAKMCDTPPKPLSNRCSIVRYLFPRSRLARKLENKYVASLNAPSKVTKRGKNGHGLFYSRRIQRLGLKH